VEADEGVGFTVPDDTSVVLPHSTPTADDTVDNLEDQRALHCRIVQPGVHPSDHASL